MLPALSLAFLLLQAAKPTPLPPFNPRAATLSAIHQIDKSDADHTRFTFHEREHATTYAHGHQVFDQIRTYDVTWLNDRPYWRLIEINDQPLDEKASRKEQKLYDKAVAKKKDLGEVKQHALNNEQTIKPDSDLHLLLDPAYVFTDEDAQNTEFGVVHLILATLPPNIKPKSKCRWRYKLWITEKDNILRHYDADVPGDHSARCIDDRDIGSYTLVAGLPKMSQWAVRMHPPSNIDQTAVADYVFSDYRRFGATVTFGSVQLIPDSPAKTPTSSAPTPKK